MKVSIHRLLIAGIAIAVVAIFAVLFISFQQNRKVKDTSATVAHTQEVLLLIKSLVQSVLDNETGARGYIITGNKSFLDPLLDAEKHLAAQLASLNTLTKHNRRQQANYDSITAYVEKRVAFSRQMVEKYEQLGAEAAASLVLSGTGKYYTDQIRRIADRIESEENAILATTKKLNDNSIARLNTILYSAIGAGLVLSILVIQRIKSDIKKQKETEEKFRALLDAAPDATVMVNDKGIIQTVNQQAVNLFNYSREEIVGQPVEILIPRELRNKHIQHRAGFTREQVARPMGIGKELHALKKGGERFPVEISLSPIRTREGTMVISSIRDITDRKKSEEKFRSLLDAAPDATVIVNEEGVIQMVNVQTERLFGYTREELLGQPVELLMPAELRERHIGHRAGYASAARFRSMGAGLELNAMKKNGHRFPVEISLAPLNTDEGMLVSASVRDITHRKMLETELRKSNEELEAFTYSVSHDLRAPLRGIVGFTAILEEEYASNLDDEGKRITSVIKTNTLRMGHLIDDLLAFSRTGKQELTKSKINTKALVEELVSDLTMQHQNRAIDWEVGALAAVQADLNTIRQVWINLISNAIKYSGKNEHPKISIGSYTKPGEVVFYVRDNGVGFNEQYKHKLFGVFQRLHSTDEFEGTGVGLALVEKIISRHNGRVWAEGKENEGACFYFSLPA